MAKAKTIDLKGKEYAMVAERIRLFREDCPRGDIITKPTHLDNGMVEFETYIIKDKSDEHSASATGHSLGEVKGDKQYEKLESISCGRALAMLGYLASGEIASGDEMQDYLEYQRSKINNAVDVINHTNDLPALKEYFLNLGSLMAEPEIIEAKDKRKAELQDADN